MTDRFEQLLVAITGNDAFRVGALLSEDPDLVTTRDVQGRTPILLALYFRQEPLARLIWERAPAPDIFEASAMGETETVRTLLAEAADGANSVAPDGFGLLGLAVYFGRSETARFLLEEGSDPDTPSANEFKVRPIHSAAAHRDADTCLALIRLLLEGGADPNVAQAGGWTPLHQVAAHGRIEAAEVLMAHGASLTARSEDGRTPLEMARAKGHADLEAILGAGDP